VPGKHTKRRQCLQFVVSRLRYLRVIVYICACLSLVLQSSTVPFAFCQVPSQGKYEKTRVFQRISSYENHTNGTATAPKMTSEITNDEAVSKLYANGSFIRDSSGNEVKLVGFSGHPWHHIQPEFTLTESDIAWFASKGFNCLRAVIYWEDFEHAGEGIIDQSYFSQHLDKVVSWCSKYGVYVILDMHQWKGGSQWGGRGFPQWITAGYSTTELARDTFAYELISGQGNGAYLQERFKLAWQTLIGRYKDNPSVVGYQILNEPFIVFLDFEKRGAELGPMIMDFMDRVALSLRSIDPETMILYSPYQNYDTDGGARYNRKPALANIAWGRNHYDYASSYHEYPIDTQRPLLYERIKELYQKFVIEFGCPYMMTEFGWAIDDILVKWMEDSLGIWNKYAQNSYGIHLVWWRYSDYFDSWHPRNEDGSDRPIVPILQKETYPTMGLIVNATTVATSTRYSTPVGFSSSSTTSIATTQTTPRSGTLTTTTRGVSQAIFAQSHTAAFWNGRTSMSLPQEPLMILQNPAPLDFDQLFTRLTIALLLTVLALLVVSKCV